MTLQDIVLMVELVFLVLIWYDGRVMKHKTVESTDFQRQSLEAQKEYLGLRRRWYEQRSKRKEEKVPAVPGSTSDSSVTS